MASKLQITVTDRKTLTPEQQDQAWEIYYRTGNAALVARTLGVEPHLIRAMLNRDPIRKTTAHMNLSEEIASRWEEQEGKASGITGKLLDVVTGMLSHIESCVKNGAERTDLTIMTKHGPYALSPTEAYQWLIESRILDGAARVGMTGAKISEVMRLQSSHEMEIKAVASNRDPSQMSDAELAALAREIEDDGRPLPWGLVQWKKAKELASQPPPGIERSPTPSA